MKTYEQINKILSMLESDEIEREDVYDILGNIQLGYKKIERILENIRYLLYNEMLLIENCEMCMKTYDYTIYYLEKLNDLLIYFNNINYNNPSDILTEEMYSKIKKITREIRNELNSLIDEIDDFIDELSKIVKQHSMKISAKKQNRERGIKIRNLKLLKDKLEDVKNEFKRESNILLDNYRTILNKKLENLNPEIEKLIHISRKLYNRLELGKELWSSDVINIISGLESITAAPESEKIYVNIPLEKSPESHPVNLIQLFYRYSPFEVINIENDKGIPGAFVWFIKSKNTSFDIDNKSIFDFKNELIFKGTLFSTYTSSYEKPYVEIRDIEPIDVMSNNIPRGYIILKYTFPGKTKKAFFIKYGSNKLKNMIRLGLSLEEIENKYRYERGKTSYSGTNLSYVWFCSAGYGLSTDPWDTRCPFKDKCPRWEDCRGDRWGWRRQLFPKVFPVIRREYSYIKIRHETNISFIVPIVGSSVKVHELYEAAQFTMPYTGIPIEFEFRKPIGRALPKTNIVGIGIPTEYLKLLLRSFIDNNGNCIKITLWEEEDTTIRIDLRDLLLTKYYIYINSDRGIRTYELLGRSMKTILKDYEKFKNKILNLVSNNSNSPLINSFYNWFIETVLHTLAHAFLEYISVELQIEPNQLLYIVDVGRNEALSKVIIAENSPIGAIDIISSIQDWLKKHNKNENDFRYFIYNFLKKEHEFLNTHNSEISNYSHNIILQVEDIKKDTAVNLILEKIKDEYRKALDEGFILDLYGFTTHLLLSDSFVRLLNKYTPDENTKTRIKHMFDDLIPYVIPNFCIDGCTGCVVMNRGCSKGIAQTYTISKWALYYTLDFLLASGKSLRGPGNIYLPTILKVLIDNNKNNINSVIFISPYIDDEGVLFLKNLNQNFNLNITVITRKEFAQKYGKSLLEDNINVMVSEKAEHSKLYFIEDNTGYGILLESSANLTLSSQSYNTYKIIEGKDIGATVLNIKENSKEWRANEIR